MIHSIEEAIKRIREYRKSSGITKFRLATLAGVAEKTVRKIDSKKWNPTLSTLKCLDAIIPSDFHNISKVD